MSEGNKIEIVDKKSVPVEVDIVPKFEVSIESAAERLTELNKFISTIMVDKQDYGTVPGISKPTLFKPGAEKLENIYGFYHTFEQLDKIEDFKDKFCFYRYKCCIYHKRTNIKQAETIGSCNNRETARKNQDFYTIINTIDKMAQKRAFVGAILNACRVSSKFTQDVEDMGNMNKQVASEAYRNKVAAGGLKCEQCKAGISDKVSEFSKSAYDGKSLCMSCQTKHKGKIEDKKEEIVM